MIELSNDAGHFESGIEAGTEVAGLGSAGVVSTFQAVSTSIRKAILLRQLAPGARLVQADLSKQLGASTTPVREALRSLAAEGLVDFERYQGAVVHKLSDDELDELYEIRIALETLALRQATNNVSPEIIARGRQLVEEMSQTQDVARFVDLDREFHSSLSSASRQPRLIRLLQSLRNLSAPYVSKSLREVPDLMRSSNEEHQLLLDAVESRDVGAAQALMSRHLEATRLSLRRNEVTRP